MELKMDTKLEQLASDFHDLLKAEPGPAGREKAAFALRQMLKDPEFVAAQFTPDPGTRKVIYEDADLGFCILAHSYEGAAESRPHDHGAYWAIYGQAEGETEMTEWEGQAGQGARRQGLHDGPRQRLRLQRGHAALAASRRRHEADPRRRAQPGRHEAPLL
jgi:hypothetical protein